MEKAKEKSTFKTMLVPIGIALAFLVWGLIVFYTVGDKTVHDWDFGMVPDVPGASPYSVERKGRQSAPEPQHVYGAPAGRGLPGAPQKETGDGSP